jgi:hypothetical protein
VWKKIMEMKTIPVTEVEIINITKSLKPKNSSGYDEISSKIIKHCASEVGKPLSHQRNCSLQSDIYLERFKYSVVRPIHTNGDKTKTTNYRPMSLLITFKKILQTVLFNRLNQHLQAYNNLASEQFGFRKGNSVQKAIFILTNNILMELNQ